MNDFNLRKYLSNNPLLKEYGEDEFDRSPEMYSGGKSDREGSKVSQWLIDSFIAGVEAQEQFGEKWDMYATEGEGYEKLMTAAEETILSTDSGDTTEEELIDAAQSQYKELAENNLVEEELSLKAGEPVIYQGRKAIFKRHGHPGKTAHIEADDEYIEVPVSKLKKDPDYDYTKASPHAVKKI